MRDLGRVRRGRRRGPGPAGRAAPPRPGRRGAAHRARTAWGRSTADAGPPGLTPRSSLELPPAGPPGVRDPVRAGSGLAALHLAHPLLRSASAASRRSAAPADLVAGLTRSLDWGDDDPGTDLILAYLESAPDPRRFARTARRISRAQARSWRQRSCRHQCRAPGGILAHRRDGGGRGGGRGAVPPGRQRSGPGSMNEMFDVAAVLSCSACTRGTAGRGAHQRRPPPTLVADACEAAGPLVPELSDDIQAALRACLPPEGEPTGNPVDMELPAPAPQQVRPVAAPARRGRGDRRDHHGVHRRLHPR